MKTHIADIKAIAHHLGEVDKAIEERELITKIVCTLPAPFRNFVSSWRHISVDRQTMVSLTSLLLQEEKSVDGLLKEAAVKRRLFTQNNRPRLMEGTTSLHNTLFMPIHRLVHHTTTIATTLKEEDETTIAISMTRIVSPDSTTTNTANQR
jgi:hypothetical protein